MRTLIPVILITITVLFSCRENKATVSPEDSKPDELKIQENPSAQTDNADDEDINDEDYGGPGLDETRVQSNTIEQPRQEFLANLRQKNLSALIDSCGYLVQESSRDGVSYSHQTDESFMLSGNTVSRLLEHIPLIDDEMDYFLWPLENDYENFQDGIYLDGHFIEPYNVSGFDSSTAAGVSVLNKCLNKLEYNYSYDFNVKYSDDTEKPFMVNIRTYLKNEKLYIFEIRLSDTKM